MKKRNIVVNSFCYRQSFRYGSGDTKCPVKHPTLWRMKEFKGPKSIGQLFTGHNHSSHPKKRKEALDNAHITLNCVFDWFLSRKKIGLGKTPDVEKFWRAQNTLVCQDEKFQDGMNKNIANITMSHMNQKKEQSHLKSAVALRAP